MKQCVDPESIRAGVRKAESEKRGDDSGIRREFGSERADALRLTTMDAQEDPTQSSACAGF